MNSKTNGRTRIELTIEELEAIHNLVCDRLTGKITSLPKSETLGGIVMKVARAKKRIKALVTA